MTKYTYSISTDTLNGKVDIDALTNQIRATAITVALNRIETLADVLDIYFNAVLPSEEVTILTATVAAHNGEPIVPPPSVVYTLTSNAFQMQTDKALFEFTKGTTSTGEFKLENHEGESFVYKYLSGADWMVENAVNGDWAKFQVVDKDNILGYGAGTVLREYVRGKWIFNNEVTFCSSVAPGQLTVGLYLVCEYHSVGTVANPKMYINFHIELKDA